VARSETSPSDEQPSRPPLLRLQRCAGSRSNTMSSPAACAFTLPRLYPISRA